MGRGGGRGGEGLASLGCIQILTFLINWAWYTCGCVRILVNIPRGQTFHVKHCKMHEAPGVVIDFLS